MSFTDWINWPHSSKRLKSHFIACSGGNRTLSNKYQSKLPFRGVKTFCSFVASRQHAYNLPQTNDTATSPDSLSWNSLISQPSAAIQRGHQNASHSFGPQPVCPPANSCALLLLRLHIACDLVAGFGQQHGGKIHRDRKRTMSPCEVWQLWKCIGGFL